MAGWGKLVAGALIGVAGTVYATNEEVRKMLPKAAQDLPDSVRRRFERAVSAGRAGASSRREEILRDLEEHGGDHDESSIKARTDAGQSRAPEPPADKPEPRAQKTYRAGDTEKLDEFFAGSSEDDTRSIPRVEKDQT